MIAKAFPDAPVIWTSENPARDKDAADAVLSAAHSGLPVAVPGRNGAWLITSVDVVGSEIVVCGVPFRV